VTVSVGGLQDGFYVADDGVGIPESERRDVFEAGYSTAVDGTGFGLRIVDVHGWRIQVTDSDDGGCGSTPPDPISPSEGHALRPPRVLSTYPSSIGISTPESGRGQRGSIVLSITWPSYSTDPTTARAAVCIGSPFSR